MKQLAHRLDMMCPEIIHDHDIARAESGDQNILQVSVTYKVMYLGVDGTLETGNSLLARAGHALPDFLPYALGVLGLAAVAVMAVMLVRSRREVRLLRDEEADGHEREEESE